MTKLIALEPIEQNSAEGLEKDVVADELFEVSSETAESLLTNGLAKLAEPPIAPTPKTKEKSVQVRVLLACVHGQPDDVVSLAGEVLKTAEAAGQVDSNKAAVAYALSLKQDK